MNLKIISGGQTGVDRAALDFAIDHGIKHGGLCPKGRKAEDGPINPRYALTETESDDYKERTLKNVIDSDATVIFVRRPDFGGGTRFTAECATAQSRPVLVLIESHGIDVAAQSLKRFLRKHRVKILNVAGPRESKALRLRRFVTRTFARLLTGLDSALLASR